MLTPGNVLLERGHGAEIERDELGTASEVQRGPNKTHGEQDANLQSPKHSSPNPWSQSQAQIKNTYEAHPATISTHDTKDDKVIGAVILQHPHQHAIHASTPDLITPPESACNSSPDPKPAPPPGHGPISGSLDETKFGGGVKNTDRSSATTEQHESIDPSPRLNHAEAEAANLTSTIISIPSPTISPYLSQATTISRKVAYHRRKQATREAAGVQKSPTSTRNLPPRSRQKAPERPFTKHQSSPRSACFTKPPIPFASTCKLPGPSDIPGTFAHLLSLDIPHSPLTNPTYHPPSGAPSSPTHRTRFLQKNVRAQSLHRTQMPFSPHLSSTRIKRRP